MRLENTVKYHSPKSQAFTDSSKATGTETLTGSDVMAALGMAQHASPLGFSAFSGKMELSQKDKEKAIQLLTQYGMKHSVKVAALRKLEPKVRFKVVRTLAIFAFQDYCRSAESKSTCNYCLGGGWVELKQDVLKHPGCGDLTPPRYKKEVIKKACRKCKGKGYVSYSCRCKGRGRVIDKKQTELKGIPIYKDCMKCSGRGYARLPFSSVYKSLSSSISLDQWKRGVGNLYADMIIEILNSESEAEKLTYKTTI